MKEKDPLLKLIEDWTGREETSAKVILGFVSFICVLLFVSGFFIICEVGKLILNLF
jgi:hypothetical protein